MGVIIGGLEVSDLSVDRRMLCRSTRTGRGLVAVLRPDHHHLSVLWRLLTGVRLTKHTSSETRRRRESANIHTLQNVLCGGLR